VIKNIISDYSRMEKNKEEDPDGSAGNPNITWTTRNATKCDMKTVQDIYAHYVLHSVTTYENEVPSVDEMEKRFTEIIRKGFPYIVAIDSSSNKVCGYAYASTFRDRVGFNNTVENSVYLRHGIYRLGLGTLLLKELIDRCSGLGLRQMIAVISKGSETSEASVALHRKFGFEHKGTLKSVGYKFGSWVDCMFYQRSLGVDSLSAPTFVLGS